MFPVCDELRLNVIVSLVLFVTVQYMLSPAQTGLVFQNETHAGVGALSDARLWKKAIYECS